jgi:hypothetical protein
MVLSQKPSLGKGYFPKELGTLGKGNGFQPFKENRVIPVKLSHGLKSYFRGICLSLPYLILDFLECTQKSEGKLSTDLDA